MRFRRLSPVLAAALICCGPQAGHSLLQAAPAGGHTHSHPSEGPHHGMLIELGKEDYHAELVHDDATDTVTIYILDSSAQKSVPITAKQLTLNMRSGGKPKQFVLTAQPQPGEAAGTASAFTAMGKELCRTIDAKAASGRLNAK